MYRKIFIPKEESNLVIKLPGSYLGKAVEVIAFEVEKDDETLFAAKKEAAKKATEFFRTINVDTTGYKFNRDEANER
jgi:hypothetical protein